MKTVFALYGTAVLVGAYGYVANIVKLAGMVVHHAPVDAMLLGRGFGVVAAPLGVVLGFF